MVRTTRQWTASTLVHIALSQLQETHCRRRLACLAAASTRDKSNNNIILKAVKRGSANRHYARKQARVTQKIPGEE